MGVVQGVGFRPCVYALAMRHGLAGSVANDSQGVVIEAEGPSSAVSKFIRDLRDSPPPLARIDALEIHDIEPTGNGGFRILESRNLAGGSTPVPSDIATCAECLAELFDPADRRYRYPFLNCTNCGPRFTIIEDLPYDRAATTMAAFKMCAACEREYREPLDRRFHAQPTACPNCGPQLEFHQNGNLTTSKGEAALAAAVKMLADGGIVAIKGIGGFHLSCDATNENAVAELRRRKRRGDKPFAVMVRNVETASRYARVGPSDSALLSSPERPIALLQCAECHRALAASVAPGQTTLGLLLPYSPLHHLLLSDMPEYKPLVMTSGNRSEEPIVHHNAEAVERLASIADGLLLHNRDIHTVCDDSVVRPVGPYTMPIRRSRGYAPLPVALPEAGPSVLAVGGELKATFCLTKGSRAYLSQHIGDMENIETVQAFERSLELMQRVFRVQPEIIACDLHPGYLSTLWAQQFAASRGLPLIRVQHHHAHASALMAEHGLADNAEILCVAFDGTGYGSDGKIWGGEFFRSTYASSERLGQLRYVPLPGGDAAIRKPYRAALAHLWTAGIPWSQWLPSVSACSESERRILARQLSRGVNCPLTSSMGRLFDAASSMLAIRQEACYEAQAALEMEALSDSDPAPLDPFEICAQADGFGCDPTPVWKSLATLQHQGASITSLAAGVHRCVAEMIVGGCLLGREQTGINTVGLTGGVFQNALLVDLAQRILQEHGFQVLLHHLVPPNDGGIALGQAVAALHQR